jgi:short-subunit dehydrogenase
MERLAKISLVVSLIGILLLTYISSLISPQERDVSSLSEKDLNKKVKIYGEIISIDNYDSFAVINIFTNGSKIQGLINNANITISSNHNYSFFGRITEYNHTLQINIEKILK